MDNKDFYIVANEAGGEAFSREPAKALCQLVLTGTDRQTFYALKDDFANEAEKEKALQTQVEQLWSMCEKVDPTTIGKIAIFGREKGFMKDTPAILLAYLSSKHEKNKVTNHQKVLRGVFHRVIDNGKMLRNFAKFVLMKRKSLGALPKKLIASWFDFKTNYEIFMQSHGNDPSFRVLLRLSHPKPKNKERVALYQWILERKYNQEDLPECVRKFDDFKKGRSKEVPNAPFEYLSGLKLTESDWLQIGLKSSWQWLRQNLNTLSRHGILKDEIVVAELAEKLADPELIKKAKAFPYQLMCSYKNTQDIPHKLKEAIQDALEVATENIPMFSTDGYILVDVSGSMAQAITGKKPGSTSKVRCVDVAGLIASSMLRKNPSSTLIPFANEVRECTVNPRDTVLTNADKLAAMLKGGTDCSAPLRMLNNKGAKGDWVVLISDNQSWVSIGMAKDPYHNSNRSEKTQVTFMKEWEIYKERNPNAKLICLDIQPYKTIQVNEGKEILCVGGFSDFVFDVVNLFVKDELSEDHLLGLIEKIEI